MALLQISYTSGSVKFYLCDGIRLVLDGEQNYIMERFLMIIFILISSRNLEAQDFYLLNRGIVFAVNYVPPIILRDKGKSSFTPSEEDIKLAEKILIERYNLDLPLDSRITSFSPLQNVQHFFKNTKGSTWVF